MRMIWCTEASQDVEALYQELRGRSDWAASRLIRLIQMNTANLLSKPAIGRPMDDDTGRRELFIRFGPGAYVIRYRMINPASLAIIRISHVEEVPD